MSPMALQASSPSAFRAVPATANASCRRQFQVRAQVAGGGSSSSSVGADGGKMMVSKAEPPAAATSSSGPWKIDFSSGEKPATPLLDTINYPLHMKNLSTSELEQLAAELRAEIVHTVSKTGGHLSSSLGVVELSVALHHVFDTPDDKIIWDVGHQAYGHKILTGRRSRMHTIRQTSGLAGFPKRDESAHDAFGVGHSSTSISAALGMAVARDLLGRKNHVISVIGDGAMTAGQAYEAMNNSGYLDANMIVVLNDNKQVSLPTATLDGSSKPVGALSRALTKLQSSTKFRRLREAAKSVTKQIGGPTHEVAAKVDEYARGMISASGSSLFEELGLYYIGHPTSPSPSPAASARRGGASASGAMALADATAFPYGLRVLVVDDDPTWIKILEKMLRKCSYEVTTCGLASIALQILRERRNKFDIVISDVNMPDMDGFKLLELIGLEMDLPVIMMSIDGETSRVMKGVQHGACDYLLKPVRMKELRNIWQHVYRKKMHEVKEIEGNDSCDDLQIFRNGVEGFDERGLFMRADSDTMRKRKDMDKDHADQDSSDGATVKKARVVWSVDLHQKFVNAVNQIGFDKVGPKKILDLMNVPGLTRENVASHLQKYRLYLSRLQKQNEERIMGAARQDFSHKGPSDNLNLRSSFQEQPGNLSNGFQHSSQKIQAQINIPDPHLDDTKTSVPLKMPDKNGTSVSDAVDPQNVTSASPLSGVFSFERMPVNQDRKLSETMILECQSCVPPKQFMQYPKHNHERCDLLGDYSCLPKPDLEHPIAPGHLYAPPPVISMSCSVEGGVRDFSDVKPDLLGCMKSLSPALTCTVESVSAQLSDSVVTSTNSDQKFSSVEGLSSIKDCDFDQERNQATLLTSEEASIICGTDLTCLYDDLSGYQLQGVSFGNIGLNSIDLFQCNDEMALPGLQNNWYDDVEFPLLDGGLFA